jgi:hypothetical protein
VDRAVVWSLALIATIIIGVGFMALSKKVETVMQQAAIAAEGCFWLVLALLVARSVDGLTRG